MSLARLKRILLGEPIANQMASEEHIPKWKALAVLSSDALSSVAYATEEILIPLAAFSLIAVNWALPIALGITLLLVIVTLSYRQTIEGYPGGGGAYIVAKENLGDFAGLVAGAALLIDYVLTVSVSIASGVENLGSAFPFVGNHKEIFGGVIIFLLMLFNLRGVRESASIFALPTYLFIVSFLILIGAGIWQALTGQVPQATPLTHQVYPEIPLFLVLRAFASGCAALTGVEAISNGIPVFEAPKPKNAKITLAWMSIILATLFLSMTFLTHVFGIVPHEGETAVSLLSRRVFGNSWFYYFLQSSTALILILAANTSYADFPRLASLLAKDRYLPRQMAILGDRLVFSNGILGLSLVAFLLILVFHGQTHHLIPLYAVGVFLSFTLSQAGMILHHLKEKKAKWRLSLTFNFLGAITTLVVLLVIASTKFLMGAWMVILLMGVMIFVFNSIHTHYLAVGAEISLANQQAPGKLETVKHTVIVPISGVHRGVVDALRYALSISNDVRACYVEFDSAATERMTREWQKWAHEVPLVILKSPYRSVIAPLLDYIDDVEQTAHGDMITIVVPEFVTVKWWHYLLHNQTAFMLRTALLFKRGKVVTSVRYHLRGV